MDLYIAKRTDYDGLKIGRSSNALDRIKQLSKGHVFDTSLVALYAGKGKLEKFIHEDLSDYRIAGTEWFSVDLAHAVSVIENSEYRGKPTNPRYKAEYRLRKGLTKRSTVYLDLNPPL